MDLENNTPADNPTFDPSTFIQQLTAAQSRISELEAAAAKQQTVYAGLQTKYNNLQTAHTNLTEQFTVTQTERKTLETQIAGAGNEKTTLATQLQALEVEKVQLQKDLGSANLRHQMTALVAEKYPNLLNMIGTLDPKSDLEATEQMLQGLAKGIEATLQQKMAGYVPGGNFQSGTGSHSAQKSADQLYQEAMKKAGTPEYDTAITAWFSTLEATNQLPEITIPNDVPSLTIPQ